MVTGDRPDVLVKKKEEYLFLSDTILVHEANCSVGKLLQ
jgi:hypothetical protein